MICDLVHELLRDGICFCNFASFWHIDLSRKNPELLAGLGWSQLGESCPECGMLRLAPQCAHLRWPKSGASAGELQPGPAGLRPRPIGPV